MSFSDYEKAIAGGSPFECYKFSGTFGVRRYTTKSTEVTLTGDAEPYLPLNISRDAIRVTSDIESLETVDITVPAGCDIARLCAYERSPRDTIVEIVRSYREDGGGDYRREWYGKVLSSNTRGNYTIIETGNLMQANLAAGMSLAYYNRNCNHVLYDARCKVDRAAFTTTAVVTKVRLTKINVDNDNNADNTLLGGTIRNTRTGEEQTILENVNNEIAVGYAFFDLIEGDTVELTHGCKHNHADCKTKFNNTQNYGGFLHIPNSNPFIGGN